MQEFLNSNLGADLLSIFGLIMFCLFVWAISEIAYKKVD